MNETFTSAYTMESIKADTLTIDHAAMLARQLDIERRGRVLNRWRVRNYYFSNGNMVIPQQTGQPVR